MLLREGELTAVETQVRYVTELEAGERVIGHVWRENEHQDDYDVQFIIGSLE